ncbi:MAG TPA: hypothetical protein VGL93_20610 [Streptosporangiaceae bacterium]
MSPVTTETAVEFFGPEWAERARAAVDAGPDEELRATKLPTYWGWIDNVRATYDASWALGVTDLRDDGPVYLKLSWRDGTCHAAEIAGGDVDADYVLSGTLAVWRDLLGGDDPGRIVMYRRLRLQSGDVLRFFQGIYFFVESLAAVARVPAALP